MSGVNSNTVVPNKHVVPINPDIDIEHIKNHIVNSLTLVTIEELGKLNNKKRQESILRELEQDKTLPDNILADVRLGISGKISGDKRKFGQGRKSRKGIKSGSKGKNTRRR